MDIILKEKLSLSHIPKIPDGLTSKELKLYRAGTINYSKEKFFLKTDITLFEPIKFAKIQKFDKTLL